MASTAYIDISFDYTINMEKYIDALNALGKESEMANVANIYKDRVNFYVPELTGNLRDAKIYPYRNGASIDWNPPNGPASDYAYYQFCGRVMGPNKAVFGAQGPNKAGPGAGVQSGWVSPRKPKQLTDRMMGHKATITLKDGRVIHINGYTDPPSGGVPGPDWINKFLHHGYAPYDLPGTNITAGRYIYEAYCRALNKQPVGGYQVYDLYNVYG